MGTHPPLWLTEVWGRLPVPRRLCPPPCATQGKHRLLAGFGWCMPGIGSKRWGKREDGSTPFHSLLAWPKGLVMATVRAGAVLPSPSHLLSKDGTASSTQRGAHREGAHREGAHRAGCCGALGVWGERKAVVRIHTWLPRGDKFVTLCGTYPWGDVAGSKPWVLPSIPGAAGRSHGWAEDP